MSFYEVFTFRIFWYEIDGPGFGAKIFPGSVDPDVHALDLVRRHTQFHVPEVVKKNMLLRINSTTFNVEKLEKITLKLIW
jgi:hypothetical protein